MFTWTLMTARPQHAHPTSPIGYGNTVATLDPHARLAPWNRA